MPDQWMVYGVTGYTGALIAREAVRQGLKPLLAGRSESVAAIAGELDLESRIFSLKDADAVRQGLEGMKLVLLTAGPFSATSAPVVQACLDQGCHYLDITGEIDVFEAVFARDAEARDRNVALCPGVGFDVIPTDCVAAVLADALPDAHMLRLGFESHSGFSPGTAKTSVEGFAGGGRIRRNGRIQRVPLGYKFDRIDFGAGPRLGVTIPWGDVSTAYYTTGIPNIETYIPISPRNARRMMVANWIRPLAALRPVQALMKKRAGKVRGPDENKRSRTPAYVWGDIRNGKKEVRTARVVTANGYDVTIHGSLSVVRHLLENHAAGALTPSRLMGPDFVSRLPGCGEIEIE